MQKMRLLITGSAGHLGEALMRHFQAHQQPAVGVDLMPSPYTQHVGSIADRDFVRGICTGIDGVIHTATLHKPHVATHTQQDFIDTNITGTLNLLDAAREVGAKAFVYTSTTSAFGDAMQPDQGSPAVWVDEQLSDQPKNIYGVSKVAAENLCQLFGRNQGLNCVVLRTSRFFLEGDDDAGVRSRFADENLKVNELLFRRVDIADVVSAHECALGYAAAGRFGRFIISASTKLSISDCELLVRDAPAVVGHLYPDAAAVFEARGWSLLPRIERVYDSRLAQKVLGWAPRYDFKRALAALAEGKDFRSPLAVTIGVKGYHRVALSTDGTDAPYPI